MKSKTEITPTESSTTPQYYCLATSEDTAAGDVFGVHDVNKGLKAAIVRHAYAYEHALEYPCGKALTKVSLQTNID